MEIMTMPTTAAAAPLSPRMRDLVKAVARLTEQRGYPPSIIELAAALKVHPSRVTELAHAAKARGALLMEPRQARSIRVPAAPANRSK
jgi:Mn-dependent DtxR family transcriptional regulator